MAQVFLPLFFHFLATFSPQFLVVDKIQVVCHGFSEG